MKLTQLIAANILEAFEGGNWTDINIVDTLADITLEDAITVTAGSANSIAALTNHFKYWNDVVMQRMNGYAPVIPATNGFNVRTLNNENEWKQLVEEVHQSFKSIATAVTNFPKEKLMEMSPSGTIYYKTLQGIAEHAHYHLGQIVIIKQLIK